MKKKMLGELKVSALGLGCMGMSEFYGMPDQQRCIETIHRAFDLGITLFDTADMYGFGRNEELVGVATRQFRDKIVIATKFGILRKVDDPTFRGVCGKPEYVRQQCEKSLKHLGIEVIDLYYQHRPDPDTPIEETIGEMSKLVSEGKVRYLGLSEASPELIRRAHAVHPISALQSEYSLWTRDPEDKVLDVCEELNIGFVAYSPVGRGFLSGKIRSMQDLSEDDFRRSMPRFQESNLDKNLKIVELLEAMGQKKKCSPSQLALAWLLRKSPSIIPLFGTTRPEHLQENIDSLKVHLDDEVTLLDEIGLKGYIHGERYPSSFMKKYQLK